jgi:hypothetical protein
MTDITIPPEALKAAQRAFNEAWINEEDTMRRSMRAACLAMLKAWPKMHIGAPWVIGVPNSPSIILPLPKENSDDISSRP